MPVQGGVGADARSVTTALSCSTACDPLLALDRVAATLVRLLGARAFLLGAPAFLLRTAAFPVLAGALLFFPCPFAFVPSRLVIALDEGEAPLFHRFCAVAVDTDASDTATTTRSPFPSCLRISLSSLYHVGRARRSCSRISAAARRTRNNRSWSLMRARTSVKSLDELVAGSLATSTSTRSTSSSRLPHLDIASASADRRYSDPQPPDRRRASARHRETPAPCHRR